MMLQSSKGRQYALGSVIVGSSKWWNSLKSHVGVHGTVGEALEDAAALPIIVPIPVMYEPVRHTVWFQEVTYSACLMLVARVYMVKAISRPTYWLSSSNSR